MSWRIFSLPNMDYTYSLTLFSLHHLFSWFPHHCPVQNQILHPILDNFLSYWLYFLLPMEPSRKTHCATNCNPVMAFMFLIVSDETCAPYYSHTIANLGVGMVWV